MNSAKRLVVPPPTTTLQITIEQFNALNGHISPAYDRGFKNP